MKSVIAILLLILSANAFAQKDNAPQITVIRYDTVVIKDQSNPAVQQIMIYNRNSGKLIKSGRMDGGRKEGVWKSYYENGMISRIEEYHNDVQSGSAIAIETNGYVSKDENILNGEKSGMCREFNRNGTIKSEENYSNGKLNGWRRVFSNEGKLQEEGNWKNGVRDSINRWAYPSGKIYVEYYYKNGNISGPGKLYYESGQLKAEGNFWMGMRTERGKNIRILQPN